MKVKMLGYYTERWKAKQHENEAGCFSWVEEKDEQYKGGGNRRT